MINTDLVVKFLKEKGTSTYKEIWNNIKDELKKDFSNLDVLTLRTDLHMSILKDERLIFIQEKDSIEKLILKENYSYEDLTSMRKHVFDNIKEED